MSYPVLVLEDDADLLEALLLTLEGGGYHAHGASSSEQALRLAESIRFMVAVSDVRMAGLDGIETLRVLKARRPELLCVVMTGYADPGTPARALEVQVEDYLFKPFRARDLLNTLQQLERRREDKASYDGMFARVLAGFAPVASVKRGPPIRDALSEDARHAAFQSFYVGVRSGQIDARTGMLLWDLLERGDTLREELGFSGSPPVDGFTRLQTGYRTIRNTITALKNTPLNERPRGTGQTPPEQFDRFYNKLRSGKLSLELVKAAPTLRLSDSVALCTDPELRALRERVWMS